MLLEETPERLVADLVLLLDMEPRGANRFEGRRWKLTPGRLFGGQVIAQALIDDVAKESDPVAGPITVSAGVTALRGRDDSDKDMLRRADAALYEAKRQGRNRVCVQA